MIVDYLPKISCVCVTKNRPYLLKKSIRCYIHQNYQNKELVIISQGDPESNEEIQNYLKEVNRNDISFFIMPDLASLGSLRNTSIEIATGELICQWDDDDLYHPDRLITQYQAIRKSDRNLASIYCDFLKFFAETKELYWCDWSDKYDFSHKFLCGSIMFYKKVFNMFEVFYPEFGDQSCRQEDLNVLEKIITKGKISPIVSGNHYIYVYHGKNTYEIEHHKLTLNDKWGFKVFDRDAILYNKQLLEDTFKKVELNEKIKVCSLKELVFEYDPERSNNEI